ncbi:UNVERIFIED_CONTAM: aminotransferase class I/II-fold pyridoxal phosphate-dependent enzyme, partial [Salmonella enterica subsp. enterica serovar Weltevreden]
SKDAMILCDEVYSPLWHSVPEDEQVPPSILEVGFENVLVTGSLSKAYALAGVRVGWIATHRKELLKKFLAIRDYNTISI